MKKLHDIDLMAHADGEGDHGDLLRDPVARAKVEGLGELRAGLEVEHPERSVVDGEGDDAVAVLRARDHGRTLGPGTMVL